MQNSDDALSNQEKLANLLAEARGLEIDLLKETLYQIKLENENLKIALSNLRNELKVSEKYTKRYLRLRKLFPKFFRKTLLKAAKKIRKFKIYG